MVSVLTLLGGLGLFLIGMQVLTEGLRSLAGESLRRLLIQFTRSPYSGAATGAVSTAIIQSSSATTVTAVGFVGAGLLTFQQALGVIFGANIGTTITGWVVALVGFKLDIMVFVFPLIFLGALLKLFGNGKVQQIGWCVAGFSMLFIGIDSLQHGMSAYQDLVTPEIFPEDTFPGRLQLVGIGILITIVTQSSSAGVATALAALSVGAISFPQAAAMVIGMDVGTTFTAAIASLGGSSAMRRTGYAHVIYNVLTGILAFVLLTPFTALISNWLIFDRAGDAQIALVAFHSMFNILGVLAVIGFTAHFARLIMRIVPDRSDRLTLALDKALLSNDVAAIDAAMGSTRRIALAVFTRMASELDRERGDKVIDKLSIDSALTTLKDFTVRIHANHGTTASLRLQSTIHAQDHLIRLHKRSERLDELEQSLSGKRLQSHVGVFGQHLESLAKEGISPQRVSDAEHLRSQFRAGREQLRMRAFEDLADGSISSTSAVMTANAMRWLHRSAYHVWRITWHLQNASNLNPDALNPADEQQIEGDELAS